jgi:predicted secreted protein
MRVKILTLILTVMSLIVFLGGCSLLGLGAEPEPAPAPAAVQIVPAPVAAVEIDMTGTVGSPFVVVLPGNPSTGFSWDVEHNPAAITLLEDEYVANADAPGSDGKFRFTFEPQRAGEATIIFRYQRSGDAEPTSMVVYRANVS